nr:deoxycytidylate deaminase [Bactrocera oleae]XP_014091051.1 deoxycytidylate deaminase [Bactrocera oleae]XP_014091052.1 deoxycytidylate deaminase [Bactrocera oleae]XP_036213972.1 deoxycytidylate deaminase [Bactrocera oleae]
MTEHNYDVTTSPKSTTSNSSSSSSGDSCCRLTSDSSDELHSTSFRSTSPLDHYADKGCVNLLTDKTFHNEIYELAVKRNTNLNNSRQEACVLDNKNRIISVGNNELLTDHEFVMAIALLASTRSDDPKTKVGACIVDRKNRLIGIGYNHFPPNYTNEPYPWSKDKWNHLNNKLTYVIHAESAAIFSAQSADLRDATIYSTLMPCNECAKLIIQSGIRKVFYLHSKLFEKWIYKASRRMLHAARVTLQKLE